MAMAYLESVRRAFPRLRASAVAVATVMSLVAVVAAPSASSVLAQAPLPIAGLATVFPDDASQWDVFDYDEERAGELRLRFPGIGGRLGDITQWTFRFGDVDGSVRPKVKGRDDVWEVRVGADVAIVRTLFPGQYDEWNVTSGGERLVYAVRDFRLLEYWGLRGASDEEDYAVYTRFEGDWREWSVSDATAGEVPNAAVQLALIWLPIYMRLTTF